MRFPSRLFHIKDSAETADTENGTACPAVDAPAPRLPGPQTFPRPPGGSSRFMLRTIDVQQLRPGMYVHRMLGSWLKQPFWRTSFLADADDVARLQASVVRQVVIDVGQGLDVAAMASPASAAAPMPQDEPAAAQDEAPTPPAALSGATPLATEMERARRICEEGRDVMAAMFREARLGRMIDPAEAMPLVEEISGSVLRHPGALISVARLKTADDYTYLHSVAVSALMTALARQLKLPEQQVMEAAMGGLLHDMGKAAMPLEVLQKPGKLDDEEFRIVRLHPEEGERLLRAGGIENPAVLDIALHHHEKIDGSGYPHRLAGEQISRLARMGAICDVYDAITSNRPYKQGWDPGESLRRMASWNGHFDPVLFKAFVRSLGIYPIGTLVRLASDKLGVVVEQHSGSLLTPCVRVFFSARSRQQLLLHDVDLAAPGCQDQIVQIESPRQWGFKDLEKLWLA